MRALDGRVASIGHRLAVGGLDLCPDRQWRPGFAVHDLSQYGGDYRNAAIRVFGLGEGPAVLAVALGGPADRDGLEVGDVLVAADGEALPRAGDGRGGFDPVERMLDALERAFADGTATLELLRAGSTLSLAIEAERGCASRFQLVPSSRLNALADGRYVQITTAIGEYVADDDELAAVLAHEFAHNILRHRARLDEAGVARGFFGNFGRSARLVRETEIEADRLSVYLLDRAGFDLEAPVRFWSRFGRHGVNFLGSATHPNWRRRIRTFEAEIEAVRQARASGAVPAHPLMP
jgi:Zn-dependent protease with chaperone function